MEKSQNSQKLIIIFEFYISALKTLLLNCSIMFNNNSLKKFVHFSHNYFRNKISEIL